MSDISQSWLQARSVQMAVYTEEEEGGCRYFLILGPSQVSFLALDPKRLWEGRERERGGGGDFGWTEDLADCCRDVTLFGQENEYN